MERLKLVLVIFTSLLRQESCRSTYERLRPAKIQYGSYKKFNEADFLKDITDAPFNKCLKIRDSEAACDSFKDTFLSITNKHAQLKTDMNRGNQAPFMTKELSKQIMIRSRLRNKFNKHRTREHWENYARQRNKCMSLHWKTIKYHFSKLCENAYGVIREAKFWSSI